MIYIVKQVENMGNGVMKHQRHLLYAKRIKFCKDIKHTHEPYKDDSPYPLNQKLPNMISALKSGKELPPILIDKDNVIVDGNHRLYAHKELGREKIKVFQAIGELYQDHE